MRHSTHVMHSSTTRPRLTYQRHWTGFVVSPSQGLSHFISAISRAASSASTSSLPSRVI